jgi:tetratricopeptide (TPR) repeat protein
MRAKATVVLFLAALLAPATAAARPQLAAESAEAKPLTHAEFVGLVNAKVPTTDIVAQLRARGYDFELPAALEADLQKVEGGPELLTALREPATLEVKVNVAGAEVAVDGEARGAAPADAPISVKGLKPGKHLLRVQAERFVGERTEVFLKPGEKRTVQVTLLGAVEARPGLLGMDVNVRAGTKEDGLVTLLDSIADPAERAKNVEEMIREYSESPLALLGYRMLQVAYLEQSEYDKALEAGREALRRDPSNFQAQARQARALLGKGDMEAAFDSLQAAQQLLEQARARTAGPGGQAPMDMSQAQQTLEAGERVLEGLSYYFYAGSNQLAEPARKVAALERYLELYPSGNYTQPARVALAYAYQEAGDPARSLEAANRALAANPKEASMMVLVADALSDRGQELKRARELASGLLEVLEDPSAMPAGMAEEQWVTLRGLWQGMAHSVLGQVLMYEETAQAPAGMNKTREAVKEFQAAGPVLKEQTQLYARNLFRLGFAYAKLGELAAARDALNELIALQTIYTPHAQELLDKVTAAMQRRKQ